MAFELIKVSELPELTTPSDSNVLPIQDGDYLKRISFENLKEAVTGDVADDLAAEVTARESAVSDEATARGNADTAILADLASPYSASATYAVGDYCTKDGQLYRCTTAIITAEVWTSGHWSAVALGDDTRDLRSAFNDLVADKYELIEPTNWFNPDGTTLGILNANGTVTESSSYVYTDFIPVTDGDKIRLFRGDNMNAIYRRHITFYNSEKSVITGGSDSSGTNAYTVPSTAAYTRVTLDKPTTIPIVITRDGVAPATYTAYFEPYMAITEDFLTAESETVITNLKNKAYKSSDFANRYACSFPRTKLRQTVGIEETVYLKTGRTPSKTTYGLFSIGSEYLIYTKEEAIQLPNVAPFTSVNGFTWRMFDPLYAEIANNLTSTYANGFPRSIINENLSSCSLLAIGDSTVDQDVMTQKLLDHFTNEGVTLTLLGTLGNGNNKNEGRAGWKASDYLTDRKYDGVTNPFYNPTTQTFDFSYYMTNQGYSAPDFVILQLGINDLGSTYDYAAVWNCIKTMIDSIFDYDNSIKILLNLPTTPTGNQANIQMYLPNYQNRVVSYDEYALTHSLSEYGETKVRCSYCHFILDPDNDIHDNVHPNSGGYEKMALEIVNQINHWQNGD